MKLKQFRKEHGGAPVEARDFALQVIEYLEPDCAESQALFDAAQDLLDAFDEFENAMDDADVELG